MRRCSVFLAVALFAASSALAQQATRPPIDPEKVTINVQKLSENVYMLQFVGVNGGNMGGNVGALVGDDGIALVDAGYAELGPKLEATLKTISPKPVKYILNTHWHGDHSAADAYFGSKAVIVAQDNVRKRMQTGGRLFPPFPAAAFPVITFDEQITLRFGSDEIHGIHFPKGHTDGDTVYFFSPANVIQTGDDFVNFVPQQFPAIDQDTDGSGGPDGEIAADEYILSHAPDDVKIIPGHGNLTTKQDVAKDLALLKEAAADVQAGLKAGKSVDQLKQENVLAKWNYLFQGRFKPDTYIERLYRSLAQQK